jgi:hypothetical protein
MEARYLMLDPRTYKLEHGQLFKIQTCQFCGHHEFNYQRYKNTPYNNNNSVAWVQRCKGCKKTVSTVKKHAA